MQANNTNNNIFDDDFLDQAWENMNETLDKEMPQEKKRRRFLLWFFLMAGCVIGLLFWKGFSSNHSTPTENIPHLPIAKSITTSPNQVAQNKISKVQPEEKTTTQQTVKNDLVTPINTDLKKATTSSKVYQSKVLSPTFKNAQKHSSRQERLVNSVEPIQNFPLESASRILNPPAVLAGSGSTKAFREIYRLLEKTDEEISIKDKYWLSEIDKNANLFPHKRKVEFSAMVGLTQDFSVPKSLKKIGLISGIGIHVPVRKKWGLQSGLAFSLLSKKGMIRTSQNHAAILADNSTLNANQFDLSLYAVSTSAQYRLKNITYFEIPLLATYQLGRKWKLKAGVNWSKALNANIELFSNQEALIDNDPNSTLNLDELATSELSAPFVQEEIWKNNFVSGVLGVSWNPTKRLSLNLNYHQRWSDIYLINLSENRNFDMSIPGAANAATFAEAFYQRKDFYKSLRLTAGYRF